MKLRDITGSEVVRATGTATLLLSFALSLAGQKLPDPKLTPGVVRLTDAATICATKWGLDRRHVTKAMKLKVCSAYDITADKCTGKNFEIDHLIPREIGGADDVKNLWPQGWPDAHKKDVLENRLHAAVCAGKITPPEAQQAIRKDWGAAYHKYVIPR